MSAACFRLGSSIVRLNSCKVACNGACSAFRCPFFYSRVRVPRRTYSVQPWPMAEYMSSTTAVKGFEKFLQMTHEVTGSAWWATILVTVVVARSVVTFPFAVLQRRVAGKLLTLKPQMDAVAQKVAKEVRKMQETYQWSSLRASQVFRQKVRISDVWVVDWLLDSTASWMCPCLAHKFGLLIDWLIDQLSPSTLCWIDWLIDWMRIFFPLITDLSSQDGFFRPAQRPSREILHSTHHPNPVMGLPVVRIEKCIHRSGRPRNSAHQGGVPTWWHFMVRVAANLPKKKIHADTLKNDGPKRALF